MLMRKHIRHAFVLCIKDDDCDDLEKRKIYRVVPDKKADKDGYIRVVDESGEDYLYPASNFVRVQLPHKAEQVIAAAG